MDRYALNMIAFGVWLMVARGTNVDTWHGFAAGLFSVGFALSFAIRAARGSKEGRDG